MFFNSAIETLPLPKLRQLQNKRLGSMLQRMYENVGFYRSQMDERGLKPSDIKGVEDLHKLPFTRKADLRDHYPYGLLAVPEVEIRRIHASSGTTGKPTVVGYNENDLRVFDEVVARSLVCAGARPGMKLHNAYGYGLFTGGLGMHGGASRLGMAVIPVSGGMTDRQLMILQDFKPEVMCCTPSYAQTLAEECEKRGIDTSRLAVQYAVLGAEPWTEAIRQQVETGLEVNATNIYGLSEIIGPGVSQEDFEEKGTGSYIWEDHFYPEVVDRDTGEPLPHGEEGVLVFTTLTKQAMPLLRYWTNDFCSIYYDADAKRTHIKMSAVKGRSDDMLIIRGVNFFPTQIEAILPEFGQLSPSYQLRLSRKGTLDEVQLCIEWDKEYEAELKAGDAQSYQERKMIQEKALASKIHNTIGLRIGVQVEATGTIPRSVGGKLSRLLDER